MSYVALDIFKDVPDCWVNEIINTVIYEITNYYSGATMLFFTIVLALLIYEYNTYNGKIRSGKKFSNGQRFLF